MFTRTCGGLILPRGYGGRLARICAECGEEVEYRDERRTLPEVDFHFHGASFSEKKLMLLFVGHLLFDAINYSTLFIFVYSFFIFRSLSRYYRIRKGLF